jgi:NAD(P)-dependent dehydrogenase (short-subunit alcohol dehydrogenase family)
MEFTPVYFPAPRSHIVLSKSLKFTPQLLAIYQSTLPLHEIFPILPTMAFPSPVKTFHDDTYPSINPTLSQLSTKGKNIVISGGGSGIGPGIARSFAKSGATSISILGRTQKSLLQTKEALSKGYPNTKIYTYVADITEKSTLDTTFQAVKSTVGSVDVLIANAGYMPDLHSIAASNADNWWAGFEINVRGAFNLISSFVPVASKNASIINISTAVAHMPYAPGVSGYAVSKLAGTRVFDYAAHEYPEFFVLSVHPGVIETAMNAKAVAAGMNYPHDTSK